MDMDFKWGGDASIILSVNPVLGPKLPVQVPFTSTYFLIIILPSFSCLLVVQ